jgi:hypothetical protein
MRGLVLNVGPYDPWSAAILAATYVEWAWTVAGTGDRSEVTVTWDCYLETFDRRLLAGPLRKCQLAREVPSSITAMAEA